MYNISRLVTEAINHPGRRVSSFDPRSPRNEGEALAVIDLATHRMEIGYPGRYEPQKEYLRALYPTLGDANRAMTEAWKLLRPETSARVAAQAQRDLDFEALKDRLRNEAG